MQDPQLELAELRKRVTELEERIEQLEDGSTPSAPGVDPRDAAVIRDLEPGDTIGLSQLRQRYRTRTDVRSSNTLTERIRTLVTDGPFESAGLQVWRYTGGADDE
jgi:hypothetical protein